MDYIGFNVSLVDLIIELILLAWVINLQAKVFTLENELHDKALDYVYPYLEKRNRQ